MSLQWQTLEYLYVIALLSQNFFEEILKVVRFPSYFIIKM